MRKKTPYPYIFLFLTLLALMSLPLSTTESIRGSAVSMFSMIWKPLTKFKEKVSSNNDSNSAHFSAHEEELQQLRLENSLLRSEILHLKESIQHELRLLTQINTVKGRQEGADQMASFLKKRHRLELEKLLKLQLKAIPAHIIFRSPSTWSSSLWIDVGSDTNETLGSQIVSKNSPVLIGTSIIGIIDYVGKKQSRVRLITDSGLTPSVRALRTTSNSRIVVEKIHNLIQMLERQKNILSESKEIDQLIGQLEHTLSQISTDEQVTYLAKGEVHGAGNPLWRRERHLLKGVGFNYDFSDGEGPARDLRTGKILNSQNDAPSIPIVKEGDILVTTGMDGIFPPDLLVAEVTKVNPLKEGDYYYELEAIPTAGNLDDIDLVFVIQAQSFNSDEHPPPPGW